MAQSPGLTFPGIAPGKEKFAKLAQAAFMQVYGEDKPAESTKKEEHKKGAKTEEPDKPDKPGQPAKPEQAIEPCKGKNFRLALGFDKGGSLKNFAERFNAVWFTKIQQDIKKPLDLGDLDKFQKDDLKNYCDVVEGYLFSAMKYACATGKGVFMNLHGNEKPDSVFKDVNRAKGALISYDKGIESLRDWVASNLNWTAWEVAVIMNHPELRKCTKFYYSPPGVLTEQERDVLPMLKQVGLTETLKKMKSQETMLGYWENLITSQKLDQDHYTYNEFVKDWPAIIQQAWDSLKDPMAMSYEEVGTQVGRKAGELLMARIPMEGLTDAKRNAYPGKLAASFGTLRQHDAGLLNDAQVEAFIAYVPPKK